MLSSRFSRTLHVLLTGVLLSAANLSSARAEVVLGNGTPLPGPAITVDGDLGQTKTDPGGSGTSNLFHTFSVFNILSSQGESVTFTSPLDGGGNPISITNVINRVTGGTSAITGQKFSVIDGTLTSTIPGANFWFINPNGIIFGSNALLHVDGSFHASTADYIKLADGNVFAATPSAGEVLTWAPPSAFGFLTGNPAGIQVGTQSFNILAVPVGETLSLVGGNIDVGAPTGTAPGFVLAPAGRVNLVSVASVGEATFDPAKISGSLSDGIPTDRDINVDGFAQLGTVNIRGGNLGGTVFGSVVDGKEIVIRSGKLVIDHGLVNPGFFAERNAPFPLADGGQIRVVTSGDVTITGTVPLFGTLDSGIHARGGLPNSIIAPHDTPDIIVDAGGKVTVGTPGAGIAAIRSDRFTGNTSPSPPSNGNITIKADTLEVAGGGRIAASNFFSDFFPGGPGRGGNLTVNAREVTLSGESANRFTGLATQSNFHQAYPEQFTNPLLTTAGGGKLSVTADTLTMEKGANITSDSFAFGPSGDIEITVGDMFLSRDGAPTGSIAAQSTLAGQAGNITIHATGQINIDDARISATSGGTGNGGAVNVTADQSISVSGKDAGIISLTSPPVTAALDQFAQVVSPFFETNFGVSTPDFAALVTAIEGQGIDLPDNAGWLDVLDALNKPPFSVTAVADLTPGNGGQISVTTPSLVMNAGTRIDSSTLWDGDAGQVTGTFGGVTLNNGAQIRSRSGGVAVDSGLPSVGLGQSGSVVLTVDDSILLNGSNSSVSTSTFGDGNAGNVSLSASEVNIQNGGNVTSESGGTLGGDFFVGTGNAGTVTITATGPNTLTISGKDSTVSTTTSGAGDGGSISLSSAGDVQILGGGSVSADSLSTDLNAGDTGDITITANNSITLSNGTISTQAVQADGGNIKLTAPNIVRLTGSDITTSIFKEGGGNGGNINIDPQFVLLNTSKIIANAFTGSGGNIQITADNFIPSSNSVVDASSQFGVQGTVVIQSPENDIAGSISQLPQSIVDVSGLLPESCAARHAGGRALSSFVVAGRGGLPTNPDNYLPSFGAGSAPMKSGGTAAPGMSLSDLGYTNQTTVAMAGWGCLP